MRTTEKIEGEEYVSVYEESASFQFRDVAHYRPHEFFVAGVGRNGDAVIERWTLRFAPGSLTAIAQPAGPIGAPLSPAPLIPGTVGGGPPVVPSERAHLPTFEREELLRGPWPPPKAARVRADPDGRFLLYVAEDDVLYRLDVTGGPAVPVPVADALSYPILAQACRFNRLHHAHFGRIWRLATGGCGGVPGTHDLLFFDFDNDGLFDDHAVWDNWELYDQGLINGPLVTYFY